MIALRTSMASQLDHQAGAVFPYATPLLEVKHVNDSVRDCAPSTASRRSALVFKPLR